MNEHRHERSNKWEMPSPTEVNRNLISSFMELGLQPKIQILQDRNKDRYPMLACEHCMEMSQDNRATYA